MVDNIKMMMLFLDTLYLLCSNFYKKREKDSFKISGLILLTAVFGCNIIFITFMRSHFRPAILNITLIYKLRYHIVGISIALLIVFFYIRYFRITNYDQVYNRFYLLNDSRRAIWYALAILYIVLSFGTMLGYSFYKAWLLSNWSH
jgi:hypothetical protein